jgi:hypothetical protein
MTKDQIREVFLRNGFTVKEGQTDLKDYVYDAAEELLKLAADQNARDAEMFRKLVSCCADMGAKNYDANNEPGELRIIVKATNVNKAELVAKMRSLITGFCSRVGMQ